MTGLLETAAPTPTQAADDATAHALLACWLREVPGWTLEAAGGELGGPTHGGPTHGGPTHGGPPHGERTPPGRVGHSLYGRAPTNSAATGDAAVASTSNAAGTGPGDTAEANTDRPRIVIPLPRWNARLLVGVRRVSATYRHQLELPALLQLGDGEPRPVGLAQLAVLLADTLPGSGLRIEPLLTRVLDSAAAVAGYLDGRADEIDRLWSAEPLPFAATEQALLLGHLVHPTPKSRGELGAVARQRFSPETGGRFALRWLAVDRDLVRHGSALGTPAPELAEALLRDDPAVDQAALRATRDAVGADRVLIPAHPYEADRLAADPLTADLFDTGAVVDLGAWGAPFLPTTSVRTVYRADAAWQLKFSLHVRVTNSMRVTLPKELDRAVESAALARTLVGARTREAAPHFDLVQDPAYLTLARDGATLDGFSVLLRENRWDRHGPSDVSALTTLCQDHPYGGRSRLAAIIAAISNREHRAEHVVAREWFGRFCDVVVRSLVRLYLDVGLCFEAHQQNTLVELENGWPVRGVYRDSQGYFHRAAAHDDLVAVVPGLGEVTESIFPEDLADERLVYYLFVNLTLGVINALGPTADESVLLGDLRRVLTDERSRGGRYPATLLDRLLDDDRWPCKANLLTRAHDLDELVGDISTQSVYVSLPNPLLGVGA
ncbi:IucA/IucC family protein [Jiangella alba]|uniref:Siderophore synthetase component n=1 Tax=Jiangella alba TaxID=561176 RepID=A0A1H5PCN8_9ACTN|nr:IucA/IucC family protein [Jiangella alba]SEF11693.1 Siderophore synthetase component [Jiangella alba]